MPQYTPRDAHVDTALTNISVAYMQSATNFIADKVFPTVPVAKQSDRYYVYEKGAFFKDEAQLRAPATESAGSGFDIDNTPTYFCSKWALHKDVDDETVANSDPSIDPFRDAAMFTQNNLLIRREKLFVDAYMKTGVWGTDEVGVTNFAQWDDEASSDPMDDIKRGRVKVLSQTGYIPNTLVVGYEVHEALKKHPLIVDRFKYTSSESITEQMIARLLGVDRYFVAQSVMQTSVEGAGTATYGFIHGKSALLVYSAPSPSLMMPTGGYIFSWAGFTGLNNAGIRTKRFRMENLSADRVENEMALSMKLVAADMGYYFSSVIS